MPALNKNNSAVKRIMQEARELANDPCTDYSAAPLEEDIFEWHCTLRGSPGTEFEGGLYHFRILLPAEYPFRPPSIMMLTPNGRFELNTKICISFTNYHEELWQPAWGVRTAIIGLQGFFPLKGQAAVGVGSIEYPAAERKRLAQQSREWVCPHCQQPNVELLPDPTPGLPASGGHRLGTRAEMEAEEAAKAAEETSAEVKTEDKPEVVEQPAAVATEPRPARSRPPVALDTAICIPTMPLRCTGLSLSDIKPAPIPPSLIASPYLTSPIFNREGALPRVPSEQDELWLQDTVPISPSPGASGSLGKHDDGKRHIQFVETRPPPPLSPPIVVSPPREPRRRASTMSLNNYPPNHPSNFHLSPYHARTLPLPHPHTPSSPGCARPPRGLHSRMRSDSDLAFAARTNTSHDVVSSSLR
ncbi:hypothetical protein NP233_g3054 [Leucocoprinus birnbaumii]|uniref:UBC core domain-containing protein n=1 Tax=Leucocoprinus birnbaumii TaxID=56174 RepID=A0AAD5W075_9AGAR|nr:hypothetical protein NP233_g3054 [Leucocoprinus birnbaumii]